jgi:hypothetical protein
VKRGANLHKPESVKEVIAKQQWSEGYKQNVVTRALLELQGITWTKPFYK